ncbi:MAG: hypothetical protein J5953_13105, partial [Prevotella sp.]|nr:hypothetical protein [Prevotella sp.]
MRTMIKRQFLILTCMACVLGGFAQKPSDTPVSQMEKLDRGLIAVKVNTSQCFLSWRMLG